MEDFDELDLYYLRRVINIRQETLRHMLEKHRRYYRDTDDDVLYQRKIADLEVELECLSHAKHCINLQIASHDIVVFKEKK